MKEFMPSGNYNRECGCFQCRKVSDILSVLLQIEV